MKKALIQINWVETSEGWVVKSAKAIEVANAGADLLLSRNKGLKYPAYILPEDAKRYDGVDVKIEDVGEVKKTAKTTKKPRAKTAKVAEKNDGPVKKDTGRPAVKSKEDTETAKVAEKNDGPGPEQK